MKDTKLLLISHIADPDGITPLVLARLVFENIEYKLLEIKEVDDYVKQAIENIDAYDEVHIVDLNISEELAKVISLDEKLVSKIKIFDHHISGIHLNKYPFITVIDEIDGRKESGTSIYYNYLKTISDNEVLYKKSVSGLVNQVRSIDTYDFSEIEKEEAQNIDCLFGVFGREEYVNYFSEYIKIHDEFKYTDKELLLINLEKARMNRYIEAKEKDMMTASIDGHKVGIVYAERYRSDLGNFLANKYENLDFIILINVARSISYRGIGKTDLSVFTKKYGGGGHKNAAGSPIPNNLLKDITKMIYTDVIFDDEN